MILIKVIRFREIRSTLFARENIRADEQEEVDDNEVDSDQGRDAEENNVVSEDDDDAQQNSAGDQDDDDEDEQERRGQSKRQFVRIDLSLSESVDHTNPLDEDSVEAGSDRSHSEIHLKFDWKRFSHWL